MVLNHYPRRFVSSAVMRLLVATMEYLPVEVVKSSLKEQWKVICDATVPNYLKYIFLDTAKDIPFTYC